MIPVPCLSLDELNIKSETLVISAHRAPDKLRDYCINAEKKGIKVFKKLIKIITLNNP